MSRRAMLTARTIAEMLTQIISATVVVCVGLAIGWRVHTNAPDVIAALALALLFGYAFTWAGVCPGMLLPSREAAQQSGFIPNPAVAVHAWPMQHPERAVAFWAR